jgi:hypothetical protein
MPKASKTPKLGVVPIRKGKSAKPKKSSIPTDSRDIKPESFPEQAELPEMETIANPKLEQKGKEIANRRDRIKKLKAEESGLTAEALTIMHQHEIRFYNKHGVVLRIVDSEKLEVEVD